VEKERLRVTWWRRASSAGLHWEKDALVLVYGSAMTALCCPWAALESGSQRGAMGLVWEHPTLQCSHRRLGDDNRVS